MSGVCGMSLYTVTVTLITHVFSFLCFYSLLLQLIIVDHCSILSTYTVVTHTHILHKYTLQLPCTGLSLHQSASVASSSLYSSCVTSLVSCLLQVLTLALRSGKRSVPTTSTFNKLEVFATAITAAVTAVTAAAVNAHAYCNSHITLHHTTTHATQGWRISYCSNGFLSALLIVLMFLCPESPRWLHKVGRNAEPCATLHKMNALYTAVIPQ
jgi:Sugar (and other) transporter